MSIPIQRQKRQFNALQYVHLSKIPPRFGNTVPTDLSVIGWEWDRVEVKQEALSRMFAAKAQYEGLSAPPLVYRFTDKDQEYDAETAKKTFIRAFGQRFTESIAQKPAVPFACEGEDMAAAIYIPQELAVFVLSKYDHNGHYGAKIYFDTDMNITHVEQKDRSGPFKNGGEYFQYAMCKAAQEN